MNIALRQAEQGDYDILNELETALVGIAPNRRPSFNTVLASSQHHLIVAEAASAVVGFAHLLIYEDLPHGAPAGELLGILVREDMRRRGIGMALLQQIVRVARERGVGELHINTDEAQYPGAVRLYRRLGARPVGVQLEMEMRRDAVGR